MGLTPMMQQYFAIKENYNDCIVFFRLGDFYEMFFSDAEIAAKELELVLTGRDCGLEKRAPMCGIPFHAANSYIGRLVAKGYKVAICEQVEDPKLTKGIVKRDVIKVVTPGTYTDASFIDENKNNYIMSIYKAYDNKTSSISICDISTGEFLSTSFNFEQNLILDEISKFNPKEIILNNVFEDEFVKEMKFISCALVTTRNKEYFEEDKEKILKKQFNEEADSLSKIVKFSACALVRYILDTQKISLSNINKINIYSIKDYMTIDLNSRRNLELTENLREKSKKGSLLWVLDKTQTSMGSRTLRRWIEEPLINKKMIEDRLGGVEELFEDISLNDNLREALKDIYDIERILGKISSKNVNAKDLVALKSSIGKIPNVKLVIKDTKSQILKNYYENMDNLSDIYELLDKSIKDDPSLTIKEGDIIKDSYNEEVDELRLAKKNGKDWISDLENKEREVTGIRSLKVGYNKVFGYYIEISKANYSSIPEGRYIRKQTLSNAERFITQELKEMEEKILGANEKLTLIEYNLFLEIREKVENEIDRLKNTAKIIANLDCLSNLAYIALENNYVKPNLNDKGYIDIKNGRHPVVEKVIPNGEFIPNDTFINKKDEQLLIITGPNMAGKSTYMRQVAIITLMCQIGSFVPAQAADISIVDKIFTRIGASDDLAGGKSTFMVEMWEVSNILNNATEHSLVLLDEVGRGTSTYDGLSIAWSVIEYICKTPSLKCKTLFATHYHELTKLENEIDGVKNYSVDVKEIDNTIIFLRKIVKGGADQSYGIEVAKLAGLPKDVIDRAKHILNDLEQDKSKTNNIKLGKVSLETNKETVSEINKIEENKKILNLERKLKLREIELEEALNQKEKVSGEKCLSCETKVNLEKELIKKVSSIEKLKEASITKKDSFQLDFNSISKENFVKELSKIDMLNVTPMDAMNKLYNLVKDAKNLV